MTAAGYASHGEPGPRPEYTETYYGGFVLDPDGNSIEAVHHHRSRTGEIDHVWRRTTDVAAVRDFYETIASTVGIELVRRAARPRPRVTRRRRLVHVHPGRRTNRTRPPCIRRPRPGTSVSVSPARDRGRLSRQRRAGRAPAVPPRLLRGIRDRPARQQRRSRPPRPLILTSQNGGATAPSAEQALQAEAAADRAARSACP